MTVRTEMETGTKEETTPARRDSLNLQQVADQAPAPGLDVPAITIQGATPRPHSPDLLSPPLVPTPGTDDDNRLDDDGDEDEDEDDDGNMEEMDEEVEEEEEEKEMTQDEKREMYLAVVSGDIDALEDCLDKPNSDINMVWFRENLLMTSIREGLQEMAEFLLDNGIDHTFTTTVMGLRDTPSGKLVDRFELSSRQMAYDKEMYDIVELIDLLQNSLFPCQKPRQRTPRYRRPKPESPPPDSEGGSTGRRSDGGDDVAGSYRGGSQSDTEGSNSDEGGLSGVSRRRRRKSRDLKRRSSRKDELDSADRTGVFSQFSEGFEVDSGHHSMGSSKLKVATVKEHERLSEKEENENSPTAASPRRANADQGDQSVVASSKSKQSKGQGDEEVVGGEGQDEGYASISLKSTTPCLSPDLKPLWMPVEPTNHFRPTKSTLAVRSLNQYRNLQEMYRSKVKSHQERPLQWRKVTTVGSYANESKHWKPKKSEYESNTICQTNEISSIRDLHSSASNTTSSARTGVSRSVSAVSTVSSSSTVKSSVSTASSAKPGTPVVARYMQPTKSTITKQRLSPNFAPSYGALDFTHVIRSQSAPSTSSSVSTPDLTAGSLYASLGNRSKPVPRVAGTKVLQRRSQQSVSFRR